MATDAKPSFLSLPPEIREHIYRLLLNPAANRTYDPNDYNDYNYSDSLVLYRLNQQIYFEARRIFRDLNIFVRIETPWPEAQDHVAVEGHVPILIKAQQAKRFAGHSLSVRIEAPPQMAMEDPVSQHFVILLDDLDKFTRTWFYSNLSNPGLNHFLSLKLHLRDPYTPDWDDKIMPKWMQRKMLMPFSMVKGLRQLTLTGDPAPLPSVESELRAAQAVPAAPPEHCLSEATRLKTEGNEALKQGRYHEALRIYGEAWKAIHILIRGRQRHVHAEAFFAQRMTQEPWRGKDGRLERLNLRVQLVANTCLVYLKLEDWEELIFWGMRTIVAIRQGVLGPLEEQWDVPPQDEAMLTFPAAVQMGKVYYRTAMGYKALENKAEARRLLRVAEVYLPHDESVKKEIVACALRLG
ncbi:peptidyl-prolyl isomerase D [Microdochium nivale]|nr:peptidyl-prolyl isomerase D [Microdochium nivale]